MAKMKKYGYPPVKSTETLLKELEEMLKESKVTEWFPYWDGGKEKWKKEDYNTLFEFVQTREIKIINPFEEQCEIIWEYSQRLKIVKTLRRTCGGRVGLTDIELALYKLIKQGMVESPFKQGKVTTRFGTTSYRS